MATKQYDRFVQMGKGLRTLFSSVIFSILAILHANQTGPGHFVRA